MPQEYPDTESEIRSSPYRCGETLFLRVTESHSNLQVETIVEARIIQVFKPFSMSQVMVVSLKGLDSDRQVVLKLYDRRFCAELREEKEIDAWDSEHEALYQREVRSGYARQFADGLQGDSEDGIDDWTTAEHEIFLYNKFRRLYDAETRVYKRLSDLQGQCVPKLYAKIAIRRCPEECDDPDKEEFFEVRGILIEYIQGFVLTELDSGAPQNQWTAICDSAICVVRMVGDREVIDDDVKPDNLVVEVVESPDTGEVSYRPVIIDFALARLRDPEKEAMEDWFSKKITEDEEGAIGFRMEKKLRKAGGSFSYTRSRHFCRLRDGTKPN